jgi:hypothetical protein
MTTYSRNLGNLIQNQINNLKRTKINIIEELGVTTDFLDKCLSGNGSQQDYDNLITMFYDKYPISMNDIFLEKDTTNNGILYFNNKKSIESKRTTKRVNCSNIETDFYEYRDTATCKNSPFKPEYIKMLREVNNNDPYNLDVAYNKGHLLTQITFFIGPVNFYYILNDKKYCCEMNTGDSNFITPYIPHTFTKRNYTDQNEEDAIIIAVTFSSNVYNSLQEVIYCGADNISKISGNLRNPEKVLKIKIERFLELNNLTKNNIIDKLKTKYEIKIIKDLLENGIYNSEIIKDLSQIFNIFPEELKVNKLDQEVIIEKYQDNYHKYEIDDKFYLIKNLVSSKHFPDVNSQLVKIVGEGHKLISSYHQYIYNFSQYPIELNYGKKNLEMKIILEKDDSIYIKPFIYYNFNKINDDSQVLCIKLSGKINSNVLNEFSTFEVNGKNRIQTENSKWW